MNHLTYIFIASPSLGCLDNWLPVLSGLKSRNQDAQFAIVIPKWRTVKEVRAESLMVNICDEIFDEFHCKQELGWRSGKTAISVQSSTQSFIWAVINKIGSSFRHINLLRAVKITIDNVWTRVHVARAFGLIRTRSVRTILLCDIWVEPKPYMHRFLLSFPETPRFSIYHGVDVVNAGIDDPSRYPELRVNKLVRRKVMLFSGHDKAIWRRVFGLRDDDLSVVGIPKHSKRWMDYIKTKNKALSSDMPSKFIGVIGRGAWDEYLPRERKLRVLSAVKTVAQQMGLPIVVKKHPKEGNDGTYAEVFDINLMGTTWFFSDDHWFDLAPRCVFAVSFFSSVPVDLIQFNCVTIEYLDLRGIDSYEKGSYLRDISGAPVFSYRFLGLVLGVDTDEEFFKAVEKLNGNKRSIVQQIHTRYLELFRYEGDSITECCEEIEDLAWNQT